MTSELTKDELIFNLKKYFGFNRFKEKQDEIVSSVLNGNHTFVIMPTGGGKSLCYQLPALIKEGTAIIISPLIALMKNQVDSIRGYGQRDSIAHFLNSSLTKTQIKQVKEDIVSGETKLLYIAPETLTKEENIDFLRSTNISFLAVDEAHCISEWGHDFRPEYRRIREMIDSIDKNMTIVALTATATPKVQSDIVKNLQMDGVNTFITSFNRDNLRYSIQQKTSKQQAIKSIVQLVKSKPGDSGIIYVQSRKSTEELAEILRVNGVNAAPYHAGLDSKTRTRVQDDFLMEEVDVICATIAFGMGIDKPDVRFVIHYDIPKSIENYYQETGRAGRDGIRSECVAFYSYKNILTLEKFLRDKPVSEREMGAQLLEEVVAFAETSACRRQFLLHYFGEKFEVDNCQLFEAKTEMHIGLVAIDELKENFGIKEIAGHIKGKKTQDMSQFGFHKLSTFAAGKEKEEIFWHSILRQAMLHGFIYKDIETYGLLKLTKKGKEFIENPYSVDITINHDYSNEGGEKVTMVTKGNALDQTLVKMLKDLRKQVAKKNKIPPFVIFQDPSLEDMATQYPISIEDMTKITGVSEGKAKRYGRDFIDLIAFYVEENNIERPNDFVVKQVARKSRVKVSIIQGIDKKLSLDELADTTNLSMEELMNEMDMIVTSGTKLNLDYYIEENIDEYSVDDILEYFMEAESDSVDDAYNVLKEDDVTRDEIQIMRLKFLSDMAN
jgi:ATP-dependent DNA helicase RecQ